MSGWVVVLAAAAALTADTARLQEARDRQDGAALQKLISELQAQAAQAPKRAPLQYRYALAQSYLAEVALELRDRTQARAAAEAGIDAAQKAVALAPANAEYHRLLGTLCGQVIPASPLLALRYGKCAQESVNKAVELDPKSPLAHLARGIGNYYLPPQFGGGVDVAIREFEKAIEMKPQLADAWMWLGIAQRKAGRLAEARKALEKAVELNPNRVWAKQQLEKTPAK